MARYTMYAVRLTSGRFLQPSHPSNPTQHHTAESYDFAKHYDTETAACIARNHDGRDADVVAVDDSDETTMRVVSPAADPAALVAEHARAQREADQERADNDAMFDR